MNRRLSMIRPFVRACLNLDFYWLRRSFLWPEQSYKAGMLRRVQKHYGHKYLFETGTYQGETAYRLQKNFEHIYTVEVFPPLYASAQRRLAQYSNITCILGTGHEAIRQIVPTLEKAAIFWLDSHYSDLAPA